MPTLKALRPALFLSLLATAGCRATGIGRADTANLHIEASESVRIVTSTLFLPSGASVRLIEADTVEVPSQLDLLIDLPYPPRFYIQATGLGAESEVVIRVEIGDEPWLDAHRTLGPDESLEFAYGFTGLAF